VGIEESVKARTKTIVAEPFTASSFEAFGWPVLQDTDPADGSYRLEFGWADPHVNVISHGPEEISRVDGAIVCDRMYRHATHTQALLVLDVESVVAVAPAGVDFSDPAHAELVKAFRLGRHDAFVLARGTWHWGPFPLGDEPVNLYNVQGLGYARDNECVDLTRFGLVVDA
jgi:ureidoglycolate hydrolase